MYSHAVRRYYPTPSSTASTESTTMEETPASYDRSRGHHIHVPLFEDTRPRQPDFAEAEEDGEPGLLTTVLHAVVVPLSGAVVNDSEPAAGVDTKTADALPAEKQDATENQGRPAERSASVQEFATQEANVMREEQEAQTSGDVVDNRGHSN
jgi:hypothetical protein